MVIGPCAKCSVNMIIGPLVSSLKYGSDTSVKNGFMASQPSTNGGKASSVTNRSADHSSEPELLNRHHQDSLPGWCLAFHIKQYYRKSAMSAATAVDSNKHHLILPKQSIHRVPSMQLWEPVGATLIQTITIPTSPLE